MNRDVFTNIPEDYEQGGETLLISDYIGWSEMRLWHSLRSAFLDSVEHNSNLVSGCRPLYDPEQTHGPVQCWRESCDP